MIHTSQKLAENCCKGKIYNGMNDQNVGKRTQRTKTSQKILALSSFILFSTTHLGKIEQYKIYVGTQISILN